MRVLQDWWRGYSDTDVRCLRIKLDKEWQAAVGQIVPLTRGEYNALVAGEHL